MPAIVNGSLWCVHLLKYLLCMQTFRLPLLQLLTPAWVVPRNSTFLTARKSATRKKKIRFLLQSQSQQIKLDKNLKLPPEIHLLPAQHLNNNLHLPTIQHPIKNLLFPLRAHTLHNKQRPHPDLLLKNNLGKCPP